MVSQQQIQSELVTCPFLAPYHQLYTIKLKRARQKKNSEHHYFFFGPKCFPYLNENPIVREVPNITFCLKSYYGGSDCSSLKTTSN